MRLATFYDPPESVFKIPLHGRMIYGDELFPRLGALKNLADYGATMSDDKLEIIELLNRYILSIDTHDDAEFANNFHDDAVYVSPFGTAHGRDQILATIHQWHTGGITAGKRHMIGAWRIEVDGSIATSSSSYWVLDAKDSTAIVASGGYTDELTKKNGVWKLQKRVQTIDPSFKM